MKQYPFLASRIFGTPLLIEPQKLEIILAVLGPRFGIDNLPQVDLRTYENSERRARGYRVENRVGIIPIYGTLVSRGDAFDALSGVTSYIRIAQALDTALDDDEVQSILFDIDSPGGEAAGVDALAERIFSARGKKPMTAIANEQAASAAMWIASAADEVVVTRSAVVGSIGVVMTHMDYSDMAKQIGVRITHIHAGAHKVDFSPYMALSESARESAQALINQLYDDFTASVARNRGITQDAVKRTEAALYVGQNAVNIKLADRVDSYQNTLSRLQTAARPSFSTGVNMSSNTTVDLSAPEVQQAILAARTEERARIRAILSHPEAAGRGQLAQTLVLESDLSAEQAGKILAAAPKTEQTASARAQPLTPFEQAMMQVQNPAIQPDTAETSPDTEVDDWVKRTAALEKQLSGHA